MNNIESLWQAVHTFNLPTVMVDVSHIYSAAIRWPVDEHGHRKQQKPGEMQMRQFRAPRRTAWSFVGEANKVLPPALRVYADDRGEAEDRLPLVYSALHTYAESHGLEVYWSGWIVWAGRADVIADWKRKMGGTS